MSDPNIEVLKFDTYLKAIENSIGSKLFNSLMVKMKGSDEPKDILEDGELSCAFFVSSVLALFGAVDKPRATVVSLKQIISVSENWFEVADTEVKPGDVVFYREMKHPSGNIHEHVGFVLNDKEVVSTDYNQKMVARHNLKYRPIDSFYRYWW